MCSTSSLSLTAVPKEMHTYSNSLGPIESGPTYRLDYSILLVHLWDPRFDSNQVLLTQIPTSHMCKDTAKADIY
jgi:hypothetical protein